MSPEAANAIVRSGDEFLLDPVNESYFAEPRPKLAPGMLRYGERRICWATFLLVGVPLVFFVLQARGERRWPSRRRRASCARRR
jgi:hypothetical protein